MTRPSKGCLTTTEVIKGHIKMARSAGLRVNEDKRAGTVEIFDEDIPVLRAIQKGRGQPWIAMYRDSERVTWQHNEVKDDEGARSQQP